MQATVEVQNKQPIAYQLFQEIDKCTSPIFEKGNTEEILGVVNALAVKQSEALSMITFKSFDTARNSSRTPAVRHRMAVKTPDAPIAAIASETPHRGPGRPRKESQVASSQIVEPKRGRGRPRLTVKVEQPVEVPSVKRGRGRPRKLAVAV